MIRLIKKPQVALPVAAFLLTISYCAFRPADLSDRVEQDLVEAATKESKWSTLSGYDYVCFSAPTGRAEFNPILPAQYVNIANTCGIDQTCCNLDSDTDYIGLVKNGTVQCVRARYALLTEGEKSVCIPPSKIKVTRETFSARFYSSNKSWIGKAGSDYLKVSEAP